LPLQISRPIEELAHEIDWQAAVAEFLRQLEHEGVGGAGGGCEVALGPVALHPSDLHLPDGDAREEKERSCGRPRQAKRASLLAQFLRKQILLRDAADGGGEVGAELPELGVTRRRPLAVAAEIDPFGLAGEGALEYRRQRRRGRPFEIARRIVPGELAVGERDQELVGALVREPIGDFLSHPGGGGGVGRSEQNQEAGLAERLFDRRPQMRSGRE